MREFMKQLAAERRGKDVEEVAPHECPIMVPDGKGGERACRKVLHVACEDYEGRTLGQNNQGKYYAKDEAYELARKFGHTFTTAAPVMGSFAMSGRMAC